MKTPCPRCGYMLRSEIHKVGAFRFAVYFDGGEPVELCPRCGFRLGGNAVRQRDLAVLNRKDRERRPAP